jgi:hypothetical protein
MIQDIPTRTLEAIETDDYYHLLEELRAWRSDIAAMRHKGLHTSASIARDEMLSRVETWLDPDASIIKMEQQTAQRALAAASALAIDPELGF